jgi:hypothetical protein
MLEKKQNHGSLSLATSIMRCSQVLLMDLKRRRSEVDHSCEAGSIGRMNILVLSCFRGGCLICAWISHLLGVVNFLPPLMGPFMQVQAFLPQFLAVTI